MLSIKIREDAMPTENEKEYLIKALEVFKRKIIVISPDYEILAVSGDFENMKENIKVNEKCYKALFNVDSPCIECPADEVKNTQKPSLKSRYLSSAILYRYTTSSKITNGSYGLGTIVAAIL